jgi:hypothetical protein
VTNHAKLLLLEARLRWWRAKYNFRHKKRVEYAAKVENNKKHFPNHHQALKEAEAGVRKWGPLEGEAAKECHALAEAIHKLRPPSPVPAGEGTCVPKTSWNPFRRTVARWIARELYDAVDNHGAQGQVNSGVRTRAEQTRLWEIFQHGGNVAARPGQSNHEGWDYRELRGAVDWESAESLNAALLRKPSHKLLWAETHGLADHPHFSATGR